jgi:acetylcholinesterase
MVSNGGETAGLFRAAFLQSGSPVPVGPIENGQQHYDAVVDYVGCKGSQDTLECLRGVDLQKLYEAANRSPALFSDTVGLRRLYHLC